jgi:hypothetical protein
MAMGIHRRQNSVDARSQLKFIAGRKVDSLKRQQVTIGGHHIKWHHKDWADRRGHCRWLRTRYSRNSSANGRGKTPFQELTPSGGRGNPLGDANETLGRGPQAVKSE